jgi:hypothetical protein
MFSKSVTGILHGLERPVIFRVGHFSMRGEMTVMLDLPPDVERAFLAEAQVRASHPMSR